MEAQQYSLREQAGAPDGRACGAMVLRSDIEVTSRRGSLKEERRLWKTKTRPDRLNTADCLATKSKMAYNNGGGGNRNRNGNNSNTLIG